MPPKQRSKKAPAKPPVRRFARGKKDIEHEIPDVYQEMLAEAVAAEAANPPPTPPSKRRKIDKEPQEALLGESTVQDEAVTQDPNPPKLEREGSRLQQIVLDDFSASSEDEDADFEDVEIDGVEDAGEDDLPPEQRSLQIDLSEQPATRSRLPQRRKLATPAERALRLSIHKTHLLLLLLSVSIRNHWCESTEVQAILKPLVSKKTIKQLHVDESEPPWKRSHAFNESIKEICELWRTTFQINVRGMRRAIWRSDIDMSREIDEAEDMLEFDDFKTAAQARSGSRDLGAQLFCALLRSCAVDTRLVCSLQILPFSATATQQTPEKPRSSSHYKYAPSQDYGSSTTPRRRKLNESPYPVFWVEVFSPATSTWIPLDPLVRNTINKPKTGFEPPASDQLNAMSYVTAFEDDGSARDVTRRYAQWFNAKTRKARVESTKNGEAWYASVTKFYDKKYKEDRDAIEDVELARRNEIEGMPKNVQDFKGHPLYVLERHLRRNEVIHPRKEAGKIAVGGHNSSKLESVFRRRDVHVCRSADAWYRRGRDVRRGEPPLKRAASQSRLLRGMSVDEEEIEDDTKALYAEFQTDVYVPPPVVDGRIPRNAFGNLDVYVPSMIPPGAIHVRHPMAVKAARILGIDYAEAVTGFEFKGRQGTAVINGVVTPASQRIAIVTVVVGLQSQAGEEIEAQRSRILLGIWKKWVAALRVKEQVARDYGDRVHREDEKMDANDDEEDADETYQEDEGGGGFFAEGPIERADADAEPSVPLLTLPGGKLLPHDLPPPPSYHETIVVESPHKLPDVGIGQTDHMKGSESTDSSVFGDGDHENTKIMPPTATEDHMGGGFLAEGIEGTAGGFMIEDEGEGTEVTPAQANSPLALDTAGGGFTMDGGGFEIDDDAGVDIEGDELKVEDSWHDNRQSMDREDRPARDEAAQAQMLAHSVPASSIEVAVHPQHLPAALPAGGLDPFESGVPPDAPDVAVPPASTQSSLWNDGAEDEDRMSHDPEEDEAEPEWLHESLGID